MKRNYWPLFFIGIFSFVFGMIIWTIKSATSVPLNPDKSFLKTYQEVDENYNNIITSNVNFVNKYEIDFFLNDKKINLTIDDIKYSQRVLEKISTHKDLLKVGSNVFTLSIKNKDNKKLENVNIVLNVTKSSTNDSDVIFNNNSFELIDGVYTSTFEIKEENNWNITGSFTIGEDTGYIFVKTNAK